MLVSSETLDIIKNISFKLFRLEFYQMIEIGIGFIAAILWGIHDFLVRFIVKKVNIITALTYTNIFGALFLLFFFLFSTQGIPFEKKFIVFSIIYGLLFLSATYCLYRAFELGPVFVAAPIICSYPILSLFYASILTNSPALYQWILSIVVILGIFFTIYSKSENDKSSKLKISRTIIWSIGSAIFFSVSFQLGQHQIINSFEVVSNLLARVSSVVILGVLLFNKINVKLLKINYILILILMGIVDTLALLIMVYSGNFEEPEFSSVSASTFGLITILLVCFFYKEKLKRMQIFGIFLVFSSVAILSFG